jgi:mannitol/fructose-specific phosphotransferase system IIA component (Ntr-type)
MEDILEEIVGTIGDEFEEDPPLALAEALTARRIVLGVEALTIVGAVRQGLSRLDPADLPARPEEILRAVAERERLASTYMGKGIAMPHAKLPDLDRASLLLFRSGNGVPIEGSQERARLFFVLVTPSERPKLHQKLLQRVAQLLEGSDYVDGRLASAESPEELFETIVTAEQAAID